MWNELWIQAIITLLYYTGLTFIKVPINVTLSVGCNNSSILETKKKEDRNYWIANNIFKLYLELYELKLSRYSYIKTQSSLTLHFQPSGHEKKSITILPENKIPNWTTASSTTVCLTFRAKWDKWVSREKRLLINTAIPLFLTSLQISITWPLVFVVEA